MIPEAFLVCALAVQPVFVAEQPPVSSHLIHNLTHTPAFIRFFQKDRRKVLVVAGMASVVRDLRKRGYWAFGAYTYDGLGLTKYHAVMEPWKMAFQENAFHSVYWLHPNHFKSSFVESLIQVIPLVAIEGFLMFDEELYPDWKPFLIYMAWTKLPFREGTLSIWQKPKDELYTRKERLRNKAAILMGLRVLQRQA